MPRLTIVIVTFNSAAEIERCLASLSAHPPRVSHEIVVVDNGSVDHTIESLHERWRSVRVTALGRNAGFAAANNVGLRATSAELVLLLNPDTLVPAGAIDGLVEILDAHPAAAIVGPRLVDGDGHLEISFGRMISPPAELRQKLLTAAHRRGIWPVAGWIERQARQTRPVDWVSGACLLARRAPLAAAGLFDERFALYTEDVDLCAAVRALGGGVWLAGHITVVHLRGRSAATAPQQTRSSYRRSHIAFYEKHHPRWAPVLKAYLKLRRQLPDTTNGP